MKSEVPLKKIWDNRLDLLISWFDFWVFFWFQLSVSECFDNEDFFDLFFLYRWDLGVLLSLLNQHSRSVYTTQNQITGTWDIISCGLSKSRIFVRIRHFQSKFRYFQLVFGLKNWPVFDFEIENGNFLQFLIKIQCFRKVTIFLKICKSRDLECRKDM